MENKSMGPLIQSLRKEKGLTQKIWFGKIIVVALVLCMVVSLAACGRNADNEPVKEATVPTEAIEETTEPITKPTTETTEPTTESTEPSVGQETTAPTETIEETIEPITEPTTEPTKTPTEPTAEQTEPAPTSKPKATYKKVDETVYATVTVNIRSGPSTDNKKLGPLKKGDSLKRTGIGDNGWSRVEYKDKTAYVFTEYMSTKKPTSGGNKNTSSSSVPRVANTETGISWDGKSPIIYTYTDGTTGTTPKEGATYESKPGITTTYTGYVVGSNATGSVNGVFYCEDCGKVCGNDGSNGKCVSWMTGGNHTCPACGATVPGGTCHTCK